MKNKLFGLLISVLLLTISLSGCNEEIKNTHQTQNNTNQTIESKTIYVDDSGGKNYTSIQNAIDAANSGDTVYVYNGMYSDSISINKTINLIGEDKNDTIILGVNYQYVLYISADHVNISGFTMQNGYFGIEIHSNYSSITNSIINKTSYGIYLWVYSNNNIISGNNISNNTYVGIGFSSSNDIIDFSSISNDNVFFGGTSSNNVISGNTISNNPKGICFSDSSNNNTIYDNTINSNGNGMFLEDSSRNNTIYDNIISSNGNGIYSEDFSSNNTIYDNTISYNGNGIGFDYAINNVISGNTISSNTNGIYFFNYSNNNVISGNTISNNVIPEWAINNNDVPENVINMMGKGIYFVDSSNNIIYHNNFIANTQNANDAGTNTWYSTTLTKGNYWDDYNGVGDTPYDISGGNNQDLYPLINPFDI